MNRVCAGCLYSCISVYICAGQMQCKQMLAITIWFPGASAVDNACTAGTEWELRWVFGAELDLFSWYLGMLLINAICFYFSFSICIWTEIQDRSEETNELVKGNQNFNPMILFLPAVCDMIGELEMVWIMTHGNIEALTWIIICFSVYSQPHRRCMLALVWHLLRVFKCWEVSQWIEMNVSENCSCPLLYMMNQQSLYKVPRKSPQSTEKVSTHDTKSLQNLSQTNQPKKFTHWTVHRPFRHRIYQICCLKIGLN